MKIAKKLSKYGSGKFKINSNKERYFFICLHITNRKDSDTMTDGYFLVRTTVYNEAMPISNARVYIKRSELGRGNNGNSDDDVYDADTDVSAQNYDYFIVTGGDGKSTVVRIEAPDEEYSFDENLDSFAYSLVDVYVEADNFVPIFVRGVQIFPAIQSELPLTLEPNVSLFPKGYVQRFNVPDNAVVSAPLRVREYAESEITTDVLPEVIIPANIVVHLGAPSNSAAENLTVPFTEYIKNVASSEIFPTWNEEAIRANIHAQISLALNRVYTEWYTSQGYPFQITNTTQFDQAFVKGRNIFDNISKLVDEIFNTYIRRDGNYEPLFAQYCDGVRTNCNGMSQWGSQRLAEQGYTAFNILQHYYGNGIEITRTDNISEAGQSYPGTPLSLGSFGEDVLRIQIQLDRIRRDYPLIPRIERINGRFGSETDSAVRAFQDIFNLSVDGIVGLATWYKISRIYAAVTKLGEITSEGTGTRIPDEPPNVVLSTGSSGSEVRLLQYILEYLSFFYPGIPLLTVDGYFGEDTENAVIGFQKTFGLEADGVVGPATWNQLYSVSNEIADTVEITSEEQRYPGSPIGVGDTGRGVELMKIYYNRIARYYGNLPEVTENNVFDQAFESAVEEFQERFGLESDGIIGALTWTRIVELYNFIVNSENQSEAVTAMASGGISEEYPGVTLRRGISGRHVKYIQNALNIINQKNGVKKYLNVNGEYGTETESAVMGYQRRNGIYPNGVVDRALWNRLIGEADKFSSAQ